MKMPTWEDLGRVAYEEFGRQTGQDPARLAWERLDEKSRVREKWVAIARAVVVAVREAAPGTRVPNEPASRSGPNPVDEW